MNSVNEAMMGWTAGGSLRHQARTVGAIQGASERMNTKIMILLLQVEPLRKILEREKSGTEIR